MALYSFVGSFNVNTAKTATQTQAITGVGFLPKVILFFWDGSVDTTGDYEATLTLNIGFGAAISSTSRFCVMGISEDAQADSDTLCSQNNTEFMRAYTNTGTLDGILDLSTMDADGFTYIVDDQFTQAYRISYLALGGDDLTGVYIGNAPFPGGTGNYQITGVGFQPNAVIVASTFDSAASTNAGIQMCVGMATGASNQGVVYGSADDAAATTVTTGYGYTDLYSRGESYHGAFVSMDADGFTVNHKAGASVYYFHYVALKGGRFAVGNFLTRTTTGTVAETGVGFQPEALFLASANRALSTYDTPSIMLSLCIGAATSSAQTAICGFDSNDQATSDTWVTHKDGRIYVSELYTVARPEMSLTSFDADGFTGTMNVADDTTPRWVTYLAIAPLLGVPRKMEYYRRLRQ
jgi:hypothetical protein